MVAAIAHHSDRKKKLVIPEALREDVLFAGETPITLPAEQAAATPSFFSTAGSSVTACR